MKITIFVVFMALSNGSIAVENYNKFEDPRSCIQRGSTLSETYAEIYEARSWTWQCFELELKGRETHDESY